VALAWGSATALVHQLPSPFGPGHATVLALVSFAAWRLLAWRWVWWFMAGALWTSAQIHVRLADRLAAELQGSDVRVSGWVDGFPDPVNGQVGFSFRVESASPASGVPGRLRLTWYDPTVTVQPAAGFELVVRLKSPRGLVNPGGFDYERWLFQEGYGATGYVRDGRGLSEETPDLRRYWLRLRARLADRIERSALTADAAALLIALTIGERFKFGEAHWRILRRTGTSHLVAISGLHVGLVAGFVFFLCRRLALRLPIVIAARDLELAALASLGAAAVYAALAGFTVPTQRALIMLAVALLALVSRRSAAMTSGLSTALLLVLVWDPTAPLSASFWLSFVAVALLWQLAGEEGPARSAWRFFRGLTRVQWGISLGLVPVVAFFFLEVSLVSPFVNLLAIPLFSFLLVPLTLLSSLAVFLHPKGEMFVAIAGAFMQWTWDRIVPIGEWSWAAVTVLSPPWWVVALSCLGVTAALTSAPLPARQLGWTALLPIFFSKPAGLAEGSFVAEVLDVGHGLAVMVQTRAHTLIYDAGPLHRSGFDSGREIVLPAIRAKGWSSLDTLVVSHADNDHAGGAPGIVQAFPGARIMMGPDASLPGGVGCVKGQSWVWDAVLFTVLHPGRDFPQRGNESSCVLKISSAAGSLLITGDIEAAGERSLMARSDQVHADVVVVPHHGSATSSSPALVVAVDAAYAVVSAGHRNQWGFPKPEVTERWEDTGAEIIATADAGAIKVTFDPVSGVQVERRRSLERRYWSARDENQERQ